MRALRPTARAALRGRCPNCGPGALFRGYHGIPPRCSTCGTQYEAADGAWLGTIAIGYAFGAAFALLAAFAKLAWAPLRTLGLDPAWSIAAAGHRLPPREGHLVRPALPRRLHETPGRPSDLIRPPRGAQTPPLPFSHLSLFPPLPEGGEGARG
jgi:ribosomal protein L37AE/L43A